MVKPIINLDQIKYRPRPQDFAPKGDLADEFDLRIGRVANHIGAQKLGYNVTAIPPGKSGYPFHSHRINEEMFFVLQGSGEIRIGPETFPIRSGDFIACPPGGPEAAHQIRNSGTGGIEVPCSEHRAFAGDQRVSRQRQVRCVRGLSFGRRWSDGVLFLPGSRGHESRLLGRRGRAVTLTS